MSKETVPRNLVDSLSPRKIPALCIYINQALQIFLNKLCVLRPHGPSLKMALKYNYQQGYNICAVKLRLGIRC